MSAQIPDAAEFLTAAIKRSWDTLNFALAANEEAVGGLSQMEALVAEAAITAGVTAAVEELHERGLITEPTP